MSGNFNDFDLEKELSHLTPGEMTLTRVGSWVIGSEFINGLKATVSRIFTSDQDAVFYIMKLAVDKLLAVSRSLENDLLKLYLLLPDSLGEDTPVNSTQIELIRKSFEAVKDGGVAKRRRALQRVKRDIKKLVSHGVAPGVSPVGSRNPSDVRIEIGILLKRISGKKRVITSMNRNFQTAITNYFESGLLQTAADVQTDVIVTRIDDFLRSGGVNLAQIVMTSSLGLGMLDERLTLRNPLDPKYTGAVTVKSGQNAAIMGGMSLPFCLPEDTQSPLFVDSDSDEGKITATAASAPSVLVDILPFVNYSQQEYENFYALNQSGGHFVSDMKLPPYSVETLPFPYPDGIIDQVGTSDTTINFKVLVNNNIHHVSADGRVYTLEQLANRLTAAFVADAVPLMVEVESSKLRFTYIGEEYYGSPARFSFFSHAGGDPENDLNLRLGLTYERLGEYFGSDTPLSGVPYTPPDGLPEAPIPDISSELVYERAFDGVNLSGYYFRLSEDLGTTDLQEFSADDVKLGDCITIQADEETEATVPRATYHVMSTDVEEDGTIGIFVDRNILLGFDGEALSDPACSIRITREYLKIASPTSEWGETRLSGWLDNFGLDPGVTASALPTVPPLPPVPVEDYDQLSTFFTYKVVDCSNGIATIDVYMTNSEPISGIEIAFDLTKYSGQTIGMTVPNAAFSGYFSTVQVGNQTIGRFLATSLIGTALPIVQNQLVATLQVSPCECAPGEFVPIVEKIIGTEDSPIVNYVTGDLNLDNIVDVQDLILYMEQLKSSTTLVATHDSAADASGYAGLENLPGLTNVVLSVPSGVVVPKEIVFLGPTTETISQDPQDPLIYSLPTPLSSSIPAGNKNYSEGTHTTLVLEDSLEMGSPIRVRDAFVTADSNSWGWALGGVLSSSNNEVTLGLYNDAPVPDPPGSATKLTYGDPFENILASKGYTSPSPHKADGSRAKVYSLGAYTYRHVIVLLPKITRRWFELIDTDKLATYTSTYTATGTSKDIVDGVIYDYLSVNKATIEAYRSFDANMADGVVKLFRALGENRLERFKELLLSLRFDLLFELELGQLSVIEEASQLLSALADDYGSDTEMMHLMENKDEYNLTESDTVDPVDENIVWPSQE